jgi:hypothetical protein
VETGVFKPSPSRHEAATDATTRAAREIIDSEKAARNAKTERLRTARLAREASGETPPPPAKKSRRKS